MRCSAVTAATIHKRFSLLRAVLRWSTEQGYCDAIQFPRLPTVHYKQFVPPTPEELSRILENAAPHIARVILIGAYLGARVGESEMLKLTWEDVDMQQGLVRIHGAKKISVHHGASFRCAQPSCLFLKHGRLTMNE